MSKSLKPKAQLGPYFTDRIRRRSSLIYLKLIGQQVHGADNAVKEEDDLEYEEGDADDDDVAAANDDEDVGIAAKEDDDAAPLARDVSRLRGAPRGECRSRRQRCMTQLARLGFFASMIVCRPNGTSRRFFQRLFFTISMRLLRLFPKLFFE